MSTCTHEHFAQFEPGELARRGLRFNETICALRHGRAVRVCLECKALQLADFDGVWSRWKKPRRKPRSRR